MPNYGVHASEVATSISTPVVAAAGLPYVVGTAPIQAAAKPAKAGVPVLCTSWSEAVEKLGYSDDWKTYTLCEFMYSHFQLYQAQPVIFCNVLDPDKKSTGSQPAIYPLDAKRIAALPMVTKLSTLEVCKPDTPVDTQTYRIRPKDEKTDYPALYEAAGVTLRDGGIFYTQKDGETPDVALKHPSDHEGTGKYFVGIVYDKPAGADKATHVRVTCDGKSLGNCRDLKGPNSEDVLDGNPIDYFPFADKDGSPIEPKSWTVKIEWCKKAECGSCEQEHCENAEIVATTTCTIAVGQTVHAVPDEDYTAWNDEDDGKPYVQCSETGCLATAKQITVEADSVTPTVEDTDIIAGINAVDLCLSAVGMVPDLIAAPGFSHKPAIAAVMAAKAENISGLFTGKAVIDLDMDQVKDYSGSIEYKGKQNLVDPNEILCWPMVKLGDQVFHLSTQLCGLMAKTDTANAGIPYESPSNLSLQMDSAVLPDGTEVLLTLEQANVLKDNAVVTALNFGSNGWVSWGNYTACYPGNTDIKDYFIPVSRMFDFVKTTLIQTYWKKVDRPLTPRLLDNIVDSTNIWLNGLVAAGCMYGARVAVLADENPLTDTMQGIIRIHVYIAPPVPMQECDFLVEFDPSYIQTALGLA